MILLSFDALLNLILSSSSNLIPRKCLPKALIVDVQENKSYTEHTI